MFNISNHAGTRRQGKQIHLSKHQLKLDGNFFCAKHKKRNQQQNFNKLPRGVNEKAKLN